MSLVQGYSSSEEEGVQLPQLPVYDIRTYSEKHSAKSENESEAIATENSRKRKAFGATIEGAYYDRATFELQAKLERRNKSASQEVKSKARKIKKKRSKNGSDDDYLGPWARYESESEDLDQENEAEVKTEEYYNNDKKNEQESDNEASNVGSDNENENDPKSTTEFLGSQEHDYLGRTYMHVWRDLPIDLSKEPSTHECFVPKKVIHTFSGHPRGVNKLEFFPKSGHLLLSCGNDGEVRLWDLYHKFELLRVFHGHSQAVKDVTFNSSGTEFLSCGYDKKVILWDTETGEIKKSLRVKAIPNVLRFNPKNEDEFIVGLSNNDIEHYDLSSLDFHTPVQTYNHHLGAINSLTIIDDNNKFMSTGDDKTVRFWNWQINIPIKFISDPSQHSMPAAAIYPGGSFIALQSMDNSVKVIQGHGKFRFNKKKTFRGHNVAGYGIGLDISPDGKILMSGDAKGCGYFWDWKTCKLVKKLKVCDKPISCIKFHPQESSKVVLAGITGEIYFCD
ncbi:predicted protein [Scheffersomyces stipitis CBS 6054]|uniref:Pre-mRNA-processing factor 17 n=1 Tax=Scheffersomyces stipitis (strain ATCC 58785 / CBS 6054 / NBRC 10063 / NRRL Y-11545) TaxID=322104 RepID=A3GI13_PICST|nr:predicted protein [Scheffersomyces stipitis CBS 6054]EAZ62910.2 predicted protein [Scheffersomyces stipitis CBS 6054]